MEFEPLGMRLRPPVGSVMRSEGTGQAATWIVSERTDPPRFILRISRLVASEATSSPAKQIDAYVKSVSERPSADAVFSVRSRKEFELEGRPAAVLYTALREGSGADEVTAVQGYFILQTAPNEFVVVSALVADADFATVSALLERSFRSMQVASPESVARERAARMQRGERLLASLDERSLRRALDPVGAAGARPAPRWYRIHRVDGTGTDREVGYMTMTVVDAAQGAVNPDRDEKQWTKEERETGLAVRVQVRTLADAAGKTVNDTDARYWVRWDRGREMWTVRSTTRSGKTAKTSSQLGVRPERRPGSPRPTLEIAEVDASAGSEPRRWTLPESGYLSQAEALVLPRLLGAAPGPVDFGFYWYDGRSGRLAQRLDRQVPGVDGFAVLSQATLESPALEQRLDARGVLLRRTADDGSIVEATTGEALLDLWRRKGLPTQ